MRCIAILLLYCSCNFAQAGEQVGAVVIQYGTYFSDQSTAGLTFFYLEGGAKSNNPSCNTANRFVINNNWPAAKFQIAALLSAVLSGRSVVVFGTGDCNVWGDSETAAQIAIR